MNKLFPDWKKTVAWLRALPKQYGFVLAYCYNDMFLEVEERFESHEKWETMREILPHKTDSETNGAARSYPNYYLANYADNKNQSPGRLYSFVAIKKSI